MKESMEIVKKLYKIASDVDELRKTSIDGMYKAKTVEELMTIKSNLMYNMAVRLPITNEYCWRCVRMGVVGGECSHHNFYNINTSTMMEFYSIVDGVDSSHNFHNTMMGFYNNIMGGIKKYHSPNETYGIELNTKVRDMVANYISKTPISILREEKRLKDTLAEVIEIESWRFPGRILGYLLARRILDIFPLGVVHCYFCMADYDKDCRGCPYGKLHGICIYEGSNYLRLEGNIRMLKNLMNQIINDYESGHK